MIAPLSADGDRLVRPHSPVIGPVDAPVTLVEFFDPSCEACRAFHPILGQILSRYPEELRLVLRYTPLHEGSDEVVRILEAARRQDRFEEVLDRVFERPARMGRPRSARHCESLGDRGDGWHRPRPGPSRRRVAGGDGRPRTGRRGPRGGRDPEDPTFFVNGKEPAQFGPKPLYEAIVAEVERTGTDS